jgi:hypothetical protein
MNATNVEIDCPCSNLHYGIVGQFSFSVLHLSQKIYLKTVESNSYKLLMPTGCQTNLNVCLDCPMGIICIRYCWFGKLFHTLPKISIEMFISKLFFFSLLC